MPSVSKKQQRFFQLVKAVQNGKVKKKDVSKSVKDAAKSMTKKQVSDFADHRSTKRRVKKISEMFPDTDDFMFERIKIQPITNAELDAAQDKMKKQKEGLFIVWPDSIIGVDKLREKFLPLSSYFGEKVFIVAKSELDEVARIIGSERYDVWESSKPYTDKQKLRKDINGFNGSEKLMSLGFKKINKKLI